MKKTLLVTTLLAAIGIAATPAMAADCDITIGVVMELTGPAGAYGQAGAKSIEMAFRDFNDAGGVDGCKLVTDTRDSQSQGNVAVDQATQLVNIKKVPVVIGGIISSISIPILTSVTAPAGVVQVSPASSSPTLTALGARGQDQRRLLPHHHLRRAAGHGGGEICAGSGPEEARDHPRQQRLRRQHGARVPGGLREARRRHHLGHAVQREAGELFRGGERRDEGRAGSAVSGQLSGRWRDHRPRLDLRRRTAEVPAQ